MASHRLLEPGQRLGRYELISRLAIGGMAEVWLAEQTGVAGFRKKVVLKAILPQFADDPNFVNMFANEAMVAAMLNHRNIVQIYDLEAIEGTHFIAMEYVSGRTLRQVRRALIKHDRNVPRWLTVHTVMAVCDALEYAHNYCNEDGKQLGLVHRDVTPENIMVSFSGVTKVVDFGIAKAGTVSSFTQAGTLKGKYAYMAPERIRAAQGIAEADRRSDVYSIGVVLYELLSGRLPFNDTNELGLLRRILEEPPIMLRQIVPSLPERLEEIVMKALSKEVLERQQSAADLREELRDLLARLNATPAAERHLARFMSMLFEEDNPMGIRFMQKADMIQKSSSWNLESPEIDSSKFSFTALGALSSSPPPTISPNIPQQASSPTIRTVIEEVQESCTVQNTSRQISAKKVRPIADPGPVALVVDADGVSRKFVEIAFEAEKISVESAKNATAALDILQSTLIDIVVSESDLPDMNGLQFYRRLRQTIRLKDIPFIFLTSDTRIDTKISALKAGADDVLPKPCNSNELAAKSKALIDRQRRLREQARQRSYVLAGDFSVLNMTDVVNMLEMARHTGLLAVSSLRAVGEIVFQQGSIVHATYGSLAGTEAFHRMMEESGGQFEFKPTTTNESPRTIHCSATELILEGARIIDSKRRKMISFQNEETLASASTSAGKMELELLPETEITPHLATQFELGIRGGFSLGELRIFSSEEMMEWTCSSPSKERFHVLLLAEIGEGVGAMMPLSAPPTEREILAGLSSGTKLVGLDFFLRSERLLDVVLLDIHNCTSTEKWLKRVPSLIIVAPPNGDILSVGTSARVQFQTLLDHLEPRAILGLGNASLESKLKEMAYFKHSSPILKCIYGSLDDGGCDLRSLLVEGIRLRRDNSEAGQASEASA